MANVTAEIEALTLGVMRAWVAGDAKAMKKATARDFMMVVGTLPPQLLDRPSFLAAIERGFACNKFAFREVFVRQHGKAAWLVAGAELELRLGGKAWSGPFLVTGMWRRSASRQAGGKGWRRTRARRHAMVSGGPHSQTLAPSRASNSKRAAQAAEVSTTGIWARPASLSRPLTPGGVRGQQVVQASAPASSQRHRR